MTIYTPGLMWVSYYYLTFNPSYMRSTITYLNWLWWNVQWTSTKFNQIYLSRSLPCPLPKSAPPYLKCELRCNCILFILTFCHSQPVSGDLPLHWHSCMVMTFQKTFWKPELHLGSVSCKKPDICQPWLDLDIVEPAETSRGKTPELRNNFIFLEN